jgi:hypothetical protein
MRFGLGRGLLATGRLQNHIDPHLKLGRVLGLDSVSGAARTLVKATETVPAHWWVHVS